MPTILGKIYQARQPLTRVRISNEVPEFYNGEFQQSPAVIRTVDVMALIDTGATNSAIDESIQLELILPQQGAKPVLYPDADENKFRPTYSSSISLYEHYTPGSKRHEWPDIVDVLTFNLERRAFQAIIGMDILTKTKVQLDEASSISITFGQVAGKLPVGS